MSNKAYGSITVTDLLDTATYIYYSATGSNSVAEDWHKRVQSGDLYIGIYSGPPLDGGQPDNPTSAILNQLVISKYVGPTGPTAQWFYGTGLTHTSGTANLTVSGAVVGSMYLNTKTSLVYKCTAVSGSTMTWTYAGDLTTGVIDNLEVGGRNLILDTRKTITNGGYILNTYRVANASDFIAGETYTISFEGELDSSKRNWYVNIYSQSHTAGYLVFATEGFEEKNGRWQRTAIMPNLQEEDAYYLGVYAYPLGAITEGTNTISKLKVERGNTATDWTPAPEDVEASSVEYIIGTGTSAGLWKGKTDKTSLYEGMQIGYWINIAGGSLKANNATVAANIQGGVPNTVNGFAGTWLNLTLSDGTETGWYPCFYGGTTRLTTHYDVNNSIRLTFKQNISVTISGVGTYTVSGWWADAQYYSNTYDRTFYSNQVKAETAITAAHIICGTSAGYKNAAAGVSFDLSYPILYSPNAIAADTSRTDTYIMMPSVNIRTSYGADIPGFAVNKKVYLKGTIVANTFTIAATEWITAIEPSSEDSYYYIPLGSFANNATVSNAIIYFMSSSTLYKFYDGAFQQIASATMVTTEDIDDTIVDATQLWYSTEPKRINVSGDIVSFNNADDETAIRSLTAEINAVQDLHGQSNPYPAGGGVNILPPMVDGTYEGNGVKAVVKDGIATLSGTTTSSGNALIIPLTEPITAPNSFYYHCMNSVANGSFAPSIENSANTSQNVSLACSPANRISGNYTNRGGQTYDRIRFYISNGITISGTYAPMFCLTDTPQSKYIPYENICPISGWDAVNVYVRGVNQWDEEWEMGYYDANGSFVSSNSQICSKNKIPTIPNTTYYFKCGTTTTGFAGRLCYYDADGDFIQRTDIISNLGNRTFVIPDGVYFIKFHIDYSTTYNNDISINYPSTDHEYHAYNGTTYPISLDSTCYGGTLDVTSGELTVTHGFWEVQASGNFAWNKSSSYPGGFYADLRNMIGYKPLTPFICSHAKTATNISEYINGTCYCDNSLNFRLMDADATVADWQAYITEQKNNGTPITICFELATPTTIQLTPTEISTLTGMNNIWADSGSVSVTYITRPDPPAAPAAHVTNTDIKPKIWTKVKPEHNTDYPYLYYCYEFLKNNDEYNWSDVVLDIAALEKIKQLDKTIMSVTPLYYATGLALKSQSGSRVHLTDHDDENAVEHINITIPVATQGGSGTASPTNNRPINGLNNFNLIVGPTTTASDGNTYTITFDSTQYGGDLEIISGQYIKKYQYLELNGGLNQNWSIEDENTANQRYVLSLKNPGDPTLTQISNRFVFTSSAANNQTWGKMRISDKAVFYDTAKTFTTDDNNTALNKFKLWLSENPIQLCYQLVFPINTYLNPTEVTILPNENYIWSNIGNIEVTYLTAPTIPLPPTYHIENFNSSYNEWTTVIPKYDINYPYYYNCYEYLMGSGRYVWSTVFLDEATTGTIKDFRKKTNNLGYLVQSTNAKFITGQDNLTELVSTSYQTLEGLKTSTAQTKLEIDKFSIDFNDVLQGVKSSFEFIPATSTTEAAVEIKSKMIGEQEGKIYSHIGSETYQFRETSNDNPVFEIDTDGTTGRRADVTGQVGIGAGTVANYSEQWAIRKGENHGTSENPYYDLQIVWVGGDAPSTT